MKGSQDLNFCVYIFRQVLPLEPFGISNGTLLYEPYFFYSIRIASSDYEE